MISGQPIEVDGLAAKPFVQAKLPHAQHALAHFSNPRLHDGVPVIVQSQIIQDEPMVTVRLPKLMEESADERRLLGGNGITTDPDAVPISKPGPKPVVYKMGMKSIAGQFRPQNRLNQSTFSHQAVSQKHFPEEQIDVNKKRPLDLESRVGGNVQQKLPQTENDTPQKSVPQMKRRKIMSPNSSEGSVVEVTNFERHEKCQERNSHNSSFSSTSNAGFLNSDTQGLQSVQNMMNSNQKTKSRGRHRKRSNRQSLVKAPGSQAWLDSTELSHDELAREKDNSAVTPRLYKGTAKVTKVDLSRIKANMNGSRRRDFGEKSEYFANPELPTSVIYHDHESQASLSVHEGNKGSGSSLHNQFRDERGNRRGSSGRNISSDELDGETTVGVRSVVNKGSPPKTILYSSSSKKLTLASEPTSPKDLNSGLAPSSIKATDFTNRREMVRGPSEQHHKSSQGQGKAAEWSIDLVYFYTGQTIMNGPDLKLTLNEEDCNFYITTRGKKASVGGSDLRIQPKKVREIMLEKDGKKVRIETCKSENFDTKIDMETFTERDATVFARKLQGRDPTINFKFQNGNYMSKAFERRQSEPEKMKARRQEPQILQRNSNNQDQREQTRCSNRNIEGIYPKRSRIQSRIIDHMHNGEYRSQKEQTSPNQADLEDRSQKITIINPSNDDREMRSLSFKTASSPHLNGSRTSRHFLRHFQKSSPELDDASPCVKYSKEVGLGPPWRKPLIYPKSGKKKTVVEWSDLERLDEGEFLNDNIIGFYLHFLEKKLEDIQHELAKRIYFFNTFFFASLTNTHKGKKGINYEAVQKWTRSIDIFSYDYIIVPINESAHWYVAIICNLPALIQTLAASSQPESNNEVPLSPDSCFVDDIDAAPIQSGNRNTSSEGYVSALRQGSLTEEASDEQDPTSSFADMSLNTDSEKLPTPSVKAGAVLEVADGTQSGDIKQDELETLIQKDILQSATPQRIELVKDIEEAENGSSIAHSVDQQATALSKKRKRKSMPPITKRDPNSPTIITFDSLGLAHSPTIKILKDYLREEGRAKRGMEWEDLPIKGVTAKEIPLQYNFCDCGLFLLGYIEKFLDNPKDFIAKVLARQYDLKKDWPRLNPSDLRVNIRSQIQDLYRDQQSEMRESAKSTNKYRGKQQESVERILSENVAQTIPESLETKKLLQPSLETIVESSESVPKIRKGLTREDLLKMTTNPFTPEPLEETKSPIQEGARGGTGHGEPARQPEEGLPCIVLDSQPDPPVPAAEHQNSAGTRLKDRELDAAPNQDSSPELCLPRIPEISHVPNSSPTAKVTRKSQKIQVVINNPSEIQDSQPNSFQDLCQEEPSSQTPLHKINDSPGVNRRSSPLVGQDPDHRTQIRRSNQTSNSSPPQRSPSIIQLDD